MRIIDSSKPEFYVCASVIRKYLEHVVIAPDCKIIYDENRYYGLITVSGGTVMYDHIILDKMVCNPEFIWVVLTTLFSMGGIINTFIDVDNTQAQRFVKGVGFINTGILRQFPKPLAIWSMTVGEWENNRIRRHFTQKQPSNDGDQSK